MPDTFARLKDSLVVTSRCANERCRAGAKRGFFMVAATILFIYTGSCAGNPQGPLSEEFNGGTLVHEVPEFAVGSDPSWVIPDSVLVFRSWDNTSSAIKLLDVATGSTQLLDGPVDIFGNQEGPTRSLVSRRDGSTVFYHFFDPDNFFSGVLRAASLPGGGVATLEVGGGFFVLALRPDDGALAYGRDHSVVLLNLSSMQQTVVAAGSPILFSPDGSELLVQDGLLQRVHLTTGFTAEVWQRPNSLDVSVLAARWDTAGIRLLLHRDGDVEVLGPGTGRVHVIGLAFDQGERAVSRGEWSIQGDRVAFWTERCIGGGLFGGCGLFRRIVYVGNAQTGGATALAIEDAKDGSSALLFSTDGRRLYYSVGGKLYVADVP